MMPDGFDSNLPPEAEPQLTTVLKGVREQGLGPPQARVATDQNQTTPALALVAPEAVPPPAPKVSPKRLLTEAPATAKAISNNPITAATIGSNDDTLEQMLGIEKASMGQAIQQNVVDTEKEEETPGFSQAGHRMLSAFKSGYYGMMRNDRGVRLFFGLGDKTKLEKDIRDYTTMMDVEDAKLGEQQTFPERAAQAVPGLVGQLGPAALLGPWAGATSAAIDNLGSSYLHFRELPDYDDKPIPDQLARGMAVISSLANGAVFYGGEKFVMGAFQGLIAKAGGRTAASNLVEGAMVRALKDPTIRSTLLDIGKAGLHSEVAMRAYTLFGELLQGELDRAAQDTYVEGAPLNPHMPSHLDIWNRAWDAQQAIGGVGALLGMVPATHYAYKGKLAADRARSIQYRDQGLPAELALAQGEAGRNPTGLRDPLAQIQETHDVPEALRTRAVPPEQLRLMQTENGAKFSETIVRAIEAAEKSGSEVVIPTPEYVASIKTQPGADRLAPYERVGDTHTVKEEEELKPLLEKMAKEEDPVERDFKKVVEHLMTQQKYAGKIKEHGLAAATIVAEGLRVGEVDRARAAGEEPRLWEQYIKKPLEVPSGAENARLAFGKQYAEIAKDEKTKERRKGTAKQKAEEEEARAKAQASGKTYTPASALDRIQKTLKTTVGETFTAYRVKGEEGIAHLSRESAGDKPLELVRLSPQDVQGATKNGVLNIGEVPSERVFPDTQGTKTDVKPWGIRGYLEELPHAFQVTMTGKADMSTFIHEAAHFLHLRLEEMVPQKMAALDEWLGRKPGEKLTEAQMEQFAQGLERFFGEGQAPNKGLIPTFDTLSHWMGGVYGSMDKVGVPLTAEVRIAFDRLFALQEEVDIAGKAMGLDAVRLEEGIVTPEEQARLKDLQTQVKATALARSFTEDGRWGRSKTEKAMNVYRAMGAAEVTGNEANNIYSWLKTGDRLDGNNVGIDWMKLNHDDVKALGFDPENPVLKPLIEPKGEALIGYDPNYLAQAVGVPDGQALMEMLSRVEPDFKAQAEQVAENNFAEDHPGYRGMDSYVKTQGELAIHNKQLEAYHKEWGRIISKRLTGKPNTEIYYSLDRTARQQVEGATPAELRPDIAFRAQARNIQEMLKAIGKQDWAAADEFNKKAYLNGQKYRLLMDTRDNLQSLASKMKTFAEDEPTRARTALFHPEYLTIQDWFLQGMKFHEEAKVAPAEVSRALQTLYDRGENFPWRNQWDSSNFFQDWRSMPQHEAQAAMEAVKALDHMAKLQTEAIKDGRRVSLDSMVNPLVESFNKAMEGLKDVEDPDFINKKPTNWDKLRGIVAALRKPEPTFSIYDGGDYAGKWNREVKQPVYDATVAREKMLEYFSKKLSDISSERMKAAPEGEEAFRKRNATVVKIGKKYLTIEQLTGVLGAWGDVRNQDLMLRGYDWKYLDAKAEIESLLQRKLLTRGDIEYVNKLHKIAEELWKPLQETRQKEFGLKPEKVPTAPDVFMGPDGPVHLDGGYWPTVYDRKAAGLPDHHEMVSLFHPDAQQAGMANQMVHTRADSGLPMPIKTDLLTIHRNINQSINYITMYDSLTNAKRIFDDARVRDAIIRKRGQAEYDNWRGWIKALARAEGTGVPPGMEQWDGLTRFMRGAATMQYLGARVMPGLHMLTGIPAATETVGAVNMGRALADFAHNPNEFWDSTKANSNELKSLLHISDTVIPEAAFSRMMKDWEDNSGLVRGNVAVKRFLKDHMLFAMKFGQAVSGRMVFRASEHWMTDRIANGEFPGVQPGTPEAEKLTRDTADAVVRNAHGSNDVKDLAPFFRSSKYSANAFAVVAGYGNNVFNHIMRQGYFLSKGDFEKFSKSVVANMVLASLMASMWRGTLASKDPKEKDPLKWYGINAMRSVTEQYVNSVPLGGDLLRIGAAAAVSKTPWKDKLHIYGGTPGIIGPAETDIKKLGEHTGALATHLLHGSEKWGSDLHKIGHDTLDVIDYLGYPGHGASQGIKVLEHAIQGDFRLDDTKDWYDIWADSRDPMAGTQSARKFKPARKH